MTTNDGTVGRYLGWFLVALSLGSGVIHFAVAGGHFDISWKHGMFFAVVAWLQLSWSAAIIVRPTRRLLMLAVVGNLAVIGTWTMSRVWGVPVGPGAWESEPVSLADALATGLEAGIVLVSLAVLLRPAFAQRSLQPRLGLAGIGASGLAIAAVSTLALSPSYASDHHGDNDSGSETAAHGHDDPAVAGAEGADELAAEGGASAEGHSSAMIMADGTSACENAGYANEGNSGHGDRGPVPHQEMDDATRQAFQDQVAQANAVVARYPTVADAEAAGWRRITPYVPCIAAHYLKAEALGNPFDVNEPEILLYLGNDPDDEIVGLSYLQFADPEVPPEGFAGPNDPWHKHTQLCIGGPGGAVIGDENTTEEDCEGRGGRVVPLDNLWMNHMWNVPGWESRWGMFSGEHPDLGGTFNAPSTEGSAPPVETTH